MCPATASCTTAEDSVDFFLAHSFEVVRHRDLPHHETEPSYLTAGRSVRGNHLYLPWQ